MTSSTPPNHVITPVTTPIHPVLSQVSRDVSMNKTSASTRQQETSSSSGGLQSAAQPTTPTKSPGSSKQLRAWSSSDSLYPVPGEGSRVLPASSLYKAPLRTPITDSFSSNAATSYMSKSLIPCSIVVSIKERFVESIRYLFGKYVELVFPRAWLFIVVSALVCIGLGAGFFVRRPVENAEKQYALQDSIAQQDSDLFDSLFAGNRTRTQLIIVMSKNGGNILTNSFIDRLWEFHEGILNITVTADRQAESDDRPVEVALQARRQLQLDQSGGGESIDSGVDSMAAGGRWSSYFGMPYDNKKHFGVVSTADLSGNFNDDFERGDMWGGRGGEGRWSGENWEEEEAGGDWEVYDWGGDDQEWEEPDNTWGRGNAWGGRGGNAWDDEYGWDDMETEKVDYQLKAEPPECDFTSQPLKDQVSGLACRPKVKGWNFAKLCAADSEGVCIPPEGILFMYNNKEEFGNPISYPEQRIRKVHDKFVSDMWISPFSLILNEDADEITGGRGFLLKYSTVNEDEKEYVAKLWEQALIDYVRNYTKLEDANIYIKTERSLRDELSSSTQINGFKDFLVIGATALLLFVYIAAMNFSADLYRMKSISAVMGGVAAVLGYVGGVGLCYLCQLEHTNTASATPFLVLGVGVDDMFVIVNSYTLTFTHASARDRVIVALKDAGLSITITTLTNLIAFCVGASSPYLAIRNFCVFTAAGLFAGYIMALTFFLGWLCLDAQREEKRRVCLCGVNMCAVPCICRKTVNENTTKGQLSSPRAAQLRKISSSTFKLVALQAAASDARGVARFPVGSLCAKLDEKETERHQQKRSLTQGSSHQGADPATHSTECGTGIESPTEDSSPWHANSNGGEKWSDITADSDSPFAMVASEKERRRKKRSGTNTGVDVGSGVMTDDLEEGPTALRPNAVGTTQSMMPYDLDRLDDTRSEKSTKRGSECSYGRAEMDPATLYGACNYARNTTAETNADLQLSTGDSGYLKENSYTKFGPLSMSDSQLLCDSLHSESRRLRSSFLGEQRERSRVWVADKYMNIDRQVSHLYTESAGEVTRIHRKLSTQELGDAWGGGEAPLSAVVDWTAEELAEPYGNVGRKWRIMFLNYYGWFITRPLVKLLVLIVFGVYLGVAIRGCTKLKQGLDIRNLASDDSYLTNFFEVQKETFTKYGDPVTVFFRDAQQWYHPVYRETYDKVSGLIRSATYALKVKDGLGEFFKSSLAIDLPNDDPALCNQMLSAWLKTPRGANYARDFVWKDGSLFAWKLAVVPPYLSTSEEQGNFMDDIRMDVERFESLRARAFNHMFIFYESDRNILSNTLSNMAYAAAAMMLVSVLLLSSVWTGVIVIVTLIMIDVGIIGFMHYWDLPLNMLTMVNLIISIGFSVDYSAHICHTFCHCVGKTRNLRVIETLVLMGSPVLHGAISTQLGVIMLVFSNSYILRVFFKMMTLVLVLGACHGIIFLPVLLSLVGPITDTHTDETIFMSLRAFVVGVRNSIRNSLAHLFCCCCWCWCWWCGWSWSSGLRKKKVSSHPCRRNRSLELPTPEKQVFDRGFCMSPSYSSLKVPDIALEELGGKVPLDVGVSESARMKRSCSSPNLSYRVTSNSVRNDIEDLLCEDGDSRPHELLPSSVTDLPTYTAAIVPQEIHPHLTEQPRCMSSVRLMTTNVEGKERKKESPIIGLHFPLKIDKIHNTKIAIK